MSTHSDKKLERFLRAELGRTGEDRVTHLEIRAAHSSGSDRVWRGPIEKMNPDQFDAAIELLVEQLGEKMQEHADTLGALTEFRVLSQVGKEIVASELFRIRGQLGFDNNFADQGIEVVEHRGSGDARFQSQRADSAFRFALEQAQLTIADLRSQVAELRDQNAKLHARVDGAFTTKLEWQDKVEVLLDRSAERERLKLREERKATRRDKIVTTITRAAPRLLANVPGGEQLAQLAGLEDGITSALREIAGDPAKMEAFAAGLELMPGLSDKTKGFLAKAIADQAEQMQAELRKRKEALKVHTGAKK